MKLTIVSLRCGVGILALCSAPAFAQAAAPQPAPAPAEQVTSAPAANAIGATTDIIVTAQRRAERGQSVPIVVTAFSAEKLEQLNIKQPQDLYGNTPSLVVGTQGQSSRDVQSYSIRGQSTGYLASPGVAVYMAEVPLPAAVTLNLQGAPGQFVDLENVQVLSGPQGTLFGRNTTGGAVLLQPHKPTNEFGGYIEASTGTYDLKSIEGAINVPIIDDKLMVRVAGAYYDRRGYTKDLVWDKWRDNQHWYTGRIGVMFKPSERFDNYLLAYGTKSSNNGSGNILEAYNTDGLQAIGYCTAPCSVYARQVEIQKQIGPRRTRGNLDGFSNIESWGIINNTAFHVNDRLTIRNIVSFQKLKDNYATDQDASPLQQYEQSQGAREPTFPIPGFTDEFGLPVAGYQNEFTGFNQPDDYIKQVTDELQLQGNLLDNHLVFTTGGFYYNAKPAGIWGQRAIAYCPSDFTGLCGPQISLGGVTNESKAVYAQGTLDFGAVSPALERLRLTAGYRYTWDMISGVNRNYTVNPPPGNDTVSCLIDNGTASSTTVPLADAASACGFSAKLKSKAPTWTLGLDYRPVSNLLLYAKVSRGYKAGGFNTSAVRVTTQTFEPEKLTTYEGGFKSDWRLANMPVRLNATYYFSSYSNIQRPGGDTSPAGAGAAIYAAKAHIQGVEAEASIRPTLGLEIGGTVSYTHARYTEFNLPVFSPITDCSGAMIQPSGDDAHPSLADIRCAKFEYVTPWIYNIHVSADAPLPGDLGTLNLYVSYNHVSAQYTAPGLNEFLGTIQGFGLLNATLTWRDIGKSGLDASLFATNLTNKLYRVSNSNTYNNLLVDTSLYGEPRMLGLKVRYSFGGK